MGGFNIRKLNIVEEFLLSVRNATNVLGNMIKEKVKTFDLVYYILEIIA